jgi:outer membrane protein assembly factor BamB
LLSLSLSTASLVRFSAAIMMLAGSLELLFSSLLLLAHAPLSVEAAAAVTPGADGAPAVPPNYDEWTGWGGNVYNNRWNIKNTEINSTTVANVVPNCQFDYPLGVSATPVVVNYTVYYPTINGSFYALNIATCEFVWEINVAKVIYDYDIPSAIVQANSLPNSRTSPQIDGDIIYFSTQSGSLLVAADVHTGDVLGRIKVNPHPLAICTQSPTVYNGMIFQGASSQEESATLDVSYPCCDFIGSFGAYTFDRNAGEFTQVWEITTLPANSNWSGVGVWGSQPSIDPVRNQVFIGTGNTYTYPPEYEMCLGQTADCLPQDVWQESLIAIDIATGKVNWRQTISPLDGWVLICGNPGAVTSNSPLCPEKPGPDVDFAMAPTFVPASLGAGTTGVDSIVVGQKNGNIYNLNAITGEVQWVNAVGANNFGAWLSWGMAVDDAKIYYTAINYGAVPYTIEPTGQVINNSAWGSVYINSGQHVWSTPAPDPVQLAYAPPGVVNDIVFVGQGGSDTYNLSGSIIALNKLDGTVLHQIEANSVQDSGIVAHGGFVVFGTGYAYRNPYEMGSINVYGLPDAIAEGKAVASASASASAAAASASAAVSASKASAAAAASATAHKGAASRISGDLLPALYPLAFLFVPFLLIQRL